MSPTPAGGDDPRRRTLRGTARTAVRAALLPLARLVTGVRIEGLERVPAAGPLLVVANHLHNADPVLLALAFPRPLYFMAKRELFANPILAALLRFAGAFPVDRGKPDRAAFRHAEALLARGEAVAMFPEGTRSTTGRLGTGHPGAGLLALRSGVPVLPVGIIGTERLPGSGGARGRRGRGPRGVIIRFGAPVAGGIVHRVGGGAAASVTEGMMRAIAELLPEQYVG